LSEAIQLFQHEEDRLMVAHVEAQLGLALLAEGQYDEAEALFLRTVAIKQDDGDRRSEGFSQQKLGRVAHARGDFAGALDRYRRALTLYSDVGDRPSIATTLECFAELAMDEGKIRRAARLLGSADALRTGMNSDVAPIERPPRERVAAGEAALGAAMFERARDAGQAMTLDQAVEYALEEVEY
jgi:tetratricopeptide (TPR) repeat protein